VLEAAIEVERVESALELAALGLGGTYVLQRVAESTDVPPGLRFVPFDPPIHDTFAFVWRRGHEPSPATRELLRLARRHLASFGRPALPRGHAHAPPSAAEGNSV
jgi:DNA-binding transcriptional LysR family regulator